MKIAFLFPGQGSQSVGMGKFFYDNFVEAKNVFEEVDDALNQKLSHIIFEGPEEELTLTANTQPALMACSIAMLRVIEKLSGKNIKDLCSFVAGHSLGEFTALAATNAFDISTAARLLKLRGQAMQESVPPGQGAMFALLGADITAAKNIAREASLTGEICEVANDNSQQQQVLSGTVGGIDIALKLAQEKGFKAIKLKVSAPFHCSLMKPAQEKLANALNDIKILEPIVPIIANINAEIQQKADISENLIKQATNTVLWYDSMQKLKALGVTTFFEIGPGSVCTNLCKKIDKEFVATPLNTIESINNFIENI
jgi:[acyl-carrier-protein] S-malonyltransferase